MVWRHLNQITRQAGQARGYHNVTEVLLGLLLAKLIDCPSFHLRVCSSCFGKINE
ncbi:MAG: hypothetical protein ACHQXG_06070 [Nitrososphaerales archaeon]